MVQKTICLVYNTSKYLYLHRLELLKTLLDMGNTVYVLAPEDRYSSEIRNEGAKFILTISNHISDCVKLAFPICKNKIFNSRVSIDSKKFNENLKYNEIQEVMEGDVWQGIVDAWTDEPISKCYKTCKKMVHDTFIQEKL